MRKYIAIHFGIKYYDPHVQQLAVLEWHEHWKPAKDWRDVLVCILSIITSSRLKLYINLLKFLVEQQARIINFVCTNTKQQYLNVLFIQREPESTKFLILAEAGAETKGLNEMISLWNAKWGFSPKIAFSLILCRKSVSWTLPSLCKCSDMTFQKKTPPKQNLKKKTVNSPLLQLCHGSLNRAGEINQSLNCNLTLIYLLNDFFTVCYC